IPRYSGIRAVKLTANISWEPDNSGYRIVEFIKNGDAQFAGNGRVSQSFARTSPGSEIPHVQYVQSAIIPVQADDQLSVRVRHTANKSLRLFEDLTWFMVEVVPG